MPLFAYKNDWSQAGNNFHFLRLVLASMVVISHAFPLFAGVEDPWQAYGAPFNTGQVCVMAFFVISGILVTRSAILSRSLLSFIIARIARLLPGAFVCSIWMAFVVGLIFTTLSISDYLSDGSVWSFLRRNMLLISIQYNLPGVFANNVYADAVNGSLWSLRVEIRMYIIIGAIVFLMRLKPRLLDYLRYVLLVLAIVAYFRAILPPLLPAGILEPKINWIYGYYFAAGAVLFCWERLVPRNLALAVILFSASLLTVNTPLLDPLMRLTLPYLVYCFAFYQSRSLGAPRGWPDISYGIYIYAFPVQQSVSALFIPRLDLGIVPLTLISLVVSYGLAILSWKLVEEPSLRRKRKIEQMASYMFQPLRRWVPMWARSQRRSQEES